MPVNPKPFNCKIPKRIIQNEKNKPFTPDELSEVSKRVKQLTDRLISTRRAIPDNLEEAADNFAALSAQRWENVMNMVDGANLKPGSNRNMIKWLEFKLAEQFAVWRNLGGFGDGVSEAGAVRQELMRTGRKWRGGIDDTLAELGAADIIGRAQDTVRPILKNAGFDKREIDFLMTDMVEIGWHRYADEQLNVSEAGRALLKAKQQQFLKTLSSKLNAEDLETIAKAGKDIADVYNKTLDVVRASGIEVGDASKLIGYNPRIFTDEASKRLDWAVESFDEAGKIKVASETMDVVDVFNKSRKTSDFVVEDMVLLDFLLRRNDADVYSKLGVKDVKELLDAGGNKVGEALFNHLGSDTVDALVDSGIFSKIPMTTREVFNYMVQKYELPFEGLSELMVTDPARAFKQYRTQLESLSAASGRTWLLLKNSMTGGWGVPKAVRDADKALYRDFKSLAEVIPDRLKGRFGLNDDALTGISGGKNFNSFKTLEDTYVHPVAANMYRAILDISSDPQQMSYLAKVFSDINKTFRSLVLSTTGTVMRIVWGNAYQTIAAGGSIPEYGKQAAKFITLSIQKNVSDDTLKKVFDDTKKLYKGLNGEAVTEYTLYRQATASGYLGDAGSLAADSTRAKVRGRDYWKRGGSYAADSAAKYGWLSGKTFSDVKDYVDFMVNDGVSVPFRMANNTLDAAAKFALLKTLTGTGLQPGQILTAVNTKRMPSLAAAMEHVSDYFFWYDDLGKMDKLLGKYVIPFWTYASRNPIAQVRSAMRNPGRFMAYNRLYAAMNAPSSGEGEDLPRGGVADWMMDTRGLMWVIPEELSGTGKREKFFISLSGVDPIGDGLDFAGDIGKGALSLLGVKNGGNQEMGSRTRLEDRADWMKTETNNALYKYLTGSPDSMFSAYPVFQAAARTIIGKDAMGQPLVQEDEKGTKVERSFLGYKVSPLAKMWFETLLPPLGNLDRTNPGNIFGTPEIQDDRGNIVEQAKGSKMPALPGLEPGEQRSRSSTRDVSQRMIDLTEQPGSAPFNFRTLSNAGVNVNYIDVAKNMGFTESAMTKALAEGRKTILSMMNALRDVPPNERKAQELKIERYKAQWYNLQKDLLATRRWREQRGIPAFNQKMDNTRQGRIYDPVDDQKLLDEVSKW